MCLGVNLDMISNLPENVTDQILIRLPIIDAVRTSVLSTKWRYRWTTISELVFNDNHLLLPSLPHNNKKDKHINFINLVLLLHSGYVHKFELSTGYLPNFSMIDAWILFISRKNIKEFVLKFSVWSTAEAYKLPTCFFSAKQICTLDLQRCVLKPPPTFTGFCNLKSITLQDSSFVDKVGFECLISKCPVLERFTWRMLSFNLGHLNICSPNLKYLSLCSNFEDICFENTPLLSDVSIGLFYYITHETFEKFLQNETRNVVKVLNSLPSLRKLVVQQFFLQFLTMSKIPEKLPFTCHHLTYLSIDLLFEDVNDICVTLCLLNSSPNLRELEIKTYPFSKPGHGIENFWEERTLIDWNMSGLQIVKIYTNIHGSKLELELELEFIKLLLANSPMLEMLSIRSYELDIRKRKGLEFLKELLIFPRASPKAKVKFIYEYDE